MVRTWAHIHVSDVRASSGLTLDFAVDDFDAAWERARSLEAKVEREPHLSPTGYGTNAFTIRDPDGYYVTIQDATQGWPAKVLGTGRD